ncbi:M23 family metallopeptidase [Bowmanella denitrificans]|uniref:M23 family metallopeptidase n=1 Tax=Bowmanella denitrificans TaxID=366582 RepID=UPI000C9D21D2|nr:M23 family metallopeptidase [Bowmanella denitrificans]
MLKVKKSVLLLLLLLGAGFFIPEPVKIPVKGASKADWHPQSFWYEPWGLSGVHKGIDIFAETGRAVISSTNGIVLYTGTVSRGGNVVVVLGPKWRFHYFAHLSSIETAPLRFVGVGDLIGKVGDSGNAKGKAPHLHYSILRLLPVPWAIDGATQGYKKAFFVDPHTYLSGAD